MIIFFFQNFAHLNDNFFFQQNCIISSFIILKVLIMDDNENHEIDLSASAMPAMPETSRLLVEALEKGGSHI